MKMMNHVPKFVSSMIIKFYVSLSSRYQNSQALCIVQIEVYKEARRHMTIWRSTIIKMYVFVARSNFESLALEFIEFIIILVS